MDGTFPFVTHVNISVYSLIKNRWFYKKTIEAKGFRTFFRACSLFRNERLGANNKLANQEILIRLIMTYAYSA
jgi:hypothetical protein